MPMRKLLLLLVLLIVPGVYAVNDCTFVDGVCPNGFTAFLKASSNTNAHIAFPSYGSFTYNVCCPTSIIASRTNMIVSLSSDTGGHVQYPQTTFAFGSTYNELKGAWTSCHTVVGACTASESCVMKISSTGNGHAAQCSDANFPNSLCCTGFVCANQAEDCSVDSDCCSGYYCSAGTPQPDGTWSQAGNSACCQPGQVWNGVACQNYAGCAPPICFTPNPPPLFNLINLPPWRACCPISFGGDPESYWRNIIAYN